MNYEEITIEMFRRVGLDFTYEQIKEYARERGDLWFQSKTWTSEEEKSFRDWLCNKIRKRYPKASKEFIEKQAAWYLLDIGWSVKD